MLTKLSCFILFGVLTTSFFSVAAYGCSAGKQCLLEVLVTDNSGNPIRGASVSTVNQPEDQAQVSVTTDEDGKAVFKNIKPGPYRIGVEYSDFIPRAMEFTLKGGQTFNAQFVLSKGETAPPAIPTFPTEGEENA
jgi:hypothetical protein